MIRAGKAPVPGDGLWRVARVSLRAGALAALRGGVIVGLAAALVSCQAEDPPAMEVSGVQDTGCRPQQTRPCPCLPTGTGTQICLASGGGYGPCTGCPEVAMPGPTAAGTARGPAPPAQPADAQLVVDAGAPDAPPAAGGSAPGIPAPMAPTDAGSPMASLGTDGQGTAGDGGLMAAPAELGTSCGVGLPTLCELRAQKCCVRSLATDTCIAADAPCECELRDCTTLEARCDGPEDCGDGQTCCGTLQGSTYVSFSCQDSCDYRGTQRIACHESEPQCPSDTICANSQLLTNLQVCIDPATIEQ